MHLLVSVKQINYEFFHHFPIWMSAWQTLLFQPSFPNSQITWQGTSHLSTFRNLPLFTGYWKINISCQKSSSASCFEIPQCKLPRTSDLSMSNYSGCWLISSLVTVGIESVLPSSYNKYIILYPCTEQDISIEFYCIVIKKRSAYCFHLRTDHWSVSIFFPLTL